MVNCLIPLIFYEHHWIVKIKGAGGSTYMADNGNWFYSVFWKRRVRSISCFLHHQKILILAEVIAGQRSALMCNYIVHAIFNFAITRKWPFFKLQNLSSTFLSNHPETFRICSKRENQDIRPSKFWLRLSTEIMNF